GPGLDYATIGTVKKGQRVTILKTRNSWYKIRLSDQRFGWVASWLVHPKNNLKHVSNLSEATIVIDPGHGGSDSGAEYKNSTSKRYMEKTYT
ncbi:SH3 domain-containing protein, partial [Bifidobacterium longum]|nr:SH3 domain-containing protein [Bifidobacterium longum]